MRDLKFRAWSQKHQTMMGEMSIEEIYEIKPRKDFERPSVLMQYTGLKDKNGVEIYEGDIFDCIYSDHCSCKRTITWIDDGCRFIPMRDRECKQSGVNQTVFDMTRYEIKGNIYTTPNLIKNA